MFELCSCLSELSDMNLEVMIMKNVSFIGRLEGNGGLCQPLLFFILLLALARCHVFLKNSFFALQMFA